MNTYDADFYVKHCKTAFFYPMIFFNDGQLRHVQLRPSNPSSCRVSSCQAPSNSSSWRPRSHRTPQTCNAQRFGRTKGRKSPRKNGRSERFLAENIWNLWIYMEFSLDLKLGFNRWWFYDQMEIEWDLAGNLLQFALKYGPFNSMNWTVSFYMMVTLFTIVRSIANS